MKLEKSNKKIMHKKLDGYQIFGPNTQNFCGYLEEQLLNKVFKCGTKFGKMEQVLCGKNVH